jgi:hypothetical protein
MVEDTRHIRSSEELAFANINGNSSETRLEYQKHRLLKFLSEALGARWLTEQPEMQRQINAAMEGAIQDARSNPITALGPLPTVTPAGAAPARSGPSGNGWRDSGPLRPVATPMAEAVIEAMAHQAMPH